ncbi:DUF1763-domain-containing protein [Trichodelitschia bisporula]|uniref:DUF1763-domain-containing protein n=1 Tax=Trichodelitschia bisporula TaxID=703511 RepID=A0A6G1HKQ5_9PEZI|nr:DUF1763-domain-containing protein [Trichodelitschia bisporula]
MVATKAEIVRGYRHLLRGGYHAVQYSTPARYVLRDRLRLNFRQGKPEDFERWRVDNTLELLANAAKHHGLEHKLVRSLLMTWYWEPVHWEDRGVTGLSNKNGWSYPFRARAYDNFYHTLHMLNESMGLCLR